MQEINPNPNYQEIIQWLETKGQELYDSHFKIYETDYQIVYKLIAYFRKEEPGCFQYGINLKKDLILRGGLPVAVRYKIYSL